MARPRGTDAARVVSVIETKGLRGLGTEKDPVRVVTQYWDFEGNFLAEADVKHSQQIIKYESEAVKESISQEPWKKHLQ